MRVVAPGWPETPEKQVKRNDPVSAPHAGTRSRFGGAAGAARFGGRPGGSPAACRVDCKRGQELLYLAVPATRARDLVGVSPDNLLELVLTLQAAILEDGHRKVIIRFQEMPSPNRRHRLLSPWLFGLWLAGLPGVAAEREPSAGRLVHLYGDGFRMTVLEPFGWRLDTRAAPQIAHFILYPETAADWRRAPVVLLARFVPTGETLQSWLATNRERFQEACPLGEISEEVPRALESAGTFQVRRYLCPTGRQEWVAVRRVGRYLLIFSLSARQESMLEGHAGTFADFLRTFQWSTEASRDPAERP